ncbi:hypothetical protein Y032_0074g873 [Ancylostoma ceylanicum]|uniref:Uncharacterized protein n=1 Tax=Ancylostoma ceylanicum TaxID=53326 RepID=A0A016TVS8_9BILA|nr:hypothetical protein Y032_0074g873 [Ancylostoma ceylanicum]
MRNSENASDFLRGIRRLAVQSVYIAICHFQASEEDVLVEGYQRKIEWTPIAVVAGRWSGDPTTRRFSC